MGSIVFFGGCTEEDALIADPAERLLGTWTVESASALGFTVPGDGSTISFDACGDVECTGSDYVASDDISENFIYSLTETSLDISYPGSSSTSVDYFLGTWTLDNFTNDKITLSQSTILGSVVWNLKK